MKCREVSHLIAGDALQQLSWLQRLRFRFHLLMCEHCRRYAEQIRELGRGARGRFGSPPEAEQEARMEAEILRRLRRNDAD
jgi:anti-sigma factor ChrR (cupin superfamily)